MRWKVVEADPNNPAKIVVGEMAAKPRGQGCAPFEFVRPRMLALLLGQGITALGLILFFAPAGLAQGPLEQLPNQNAAQRDMAKAMDVACPALAARQNVSRSPDERQLQEGCTRLINTANEIGDEPQLGFGLTAEQTNNALQSINGEEMQATQEQIGDIQASNISGRLAAIRTGAAGRGFSIAGLRLASDPSLASVYDYGGYSSL